MRAVVVYSEGRCQLERDRQDGYDLVLHAGPQNVMVFPRTEKLMLSLCDLGYEWDHAQLRPKRWFRFCKGLDDVAPLLREIFPDIEIIEAA